MAYMQCGPGGYGNECRERERVSETFVEQDAYGRPLHNHHMGGGVGGYVASPMPGQYMAPGYGPAGPGVEFVERREERIVAEAEAPRMRMPGRGMRRRVRRHSPNRGYFSCSDSD